MALSAEESARYARHIVLKDVGGAGQQKLKSARVLVVGAGGLGGPATAYLAGAGVGALTIADHDTVSVSNLQRQVFFQSADTGAPKAQALCRFAAGLNPHIVCTPLPVEITGENADAIIAGYDLVVEASDSFEAKKASAAACARARIPMVLGALGPFDGSVTSLAPYLTGDAGRPCPGFESLYPTRPDPEDSPPCELVGVLNVLPGIVGTMMANEATKWITGYAPPLLGKLVVYSARTGETRTMRYR